ncbi:hypothetical protein J2Z62_000114 [Mycoplasmoides fastidiosum]|uniref:DUF3196 domain-containing protein n=1 Tax=Mycoplasmoides fastidiosum TaxID=92758 RepID=A0ABU0LY88_9BACT|nr:DUF3196 family protein [Mycoplasmoides fastidiosum]MDQ0513676.1 hypothetical protein [Mycoplasmoides fastidiosum]UUD37905.1 hypothetical protein NPA10_00715 [Mycoplasmoides fastidiosum]
MYPSRIEKELIEIKNYLATGEIEMARGMLEQLEEIADLDPTTSKRLNQFILSFNQTFTEDEKNFQQLLAAAFFDDIFISRYFFQWVKQALANATTEIVIDQNLQTKIANFFSHPSIHDVPKAFVFESFYMVGVSLDVKYLNARLKTTDQINTLELPNIPIYQKKKELQALLKIKTQQSPVEEQLLNDMLMEMYGFCFPNDFAFETAEIAEYTYVYLQYLLNPETAQQFEHLTNHDLRNFILFVFNEKESQWIDFAALSRV